MSITKYIYEKTEILFDTLDKDVMINATQMLKVFPHKMMGHFIKDATRREIVLKYCKRNSLITSVITKPTSLTLNDLAKIYPESIKVVKGGHSESQGTWMTKDIALEFARYLNADFAVWCNDRVLELLNFGVTAINPKEILENPEMTIEALKKVIEYREQLQQANKEIASLKPKGIYHDEVLTSKSGILTTVIAKELGMSAEALNADLKARGVIYKRGDTWVLYSKYQEEEYMTTYTTTFVRKNGDEGSRIQGMWTEKGRKFIHSLYSKSERKLYG